MAIFTLIVLACITKSLSAPIPAVSGVRTASAVIYEEDGIWGSIVFRQNARGGPVMISANFRDISHMGEGIDYEIRSEPVHYDWYAREKRCGDDALKEVLSTSGKQIGRLVRAGRMDGMNGETFAQTVFDKEISLFEEDDGYVVGRSFVVRQGGRESRFACSTILRTETELPAGLVPCVKKRYEKCLVGTEKKEECEYRSCEGFERFWGSVDHTTAFCSVVRQVYPKASGAATGERVGCSYGSHSLLIPVGNV